MHPAHRRPWLIVLWLIVFFPVGLYLVWKASAWSSRGRWTATGITVGLFLIFAVAGAASPSPPATSDAATPEAQASTVPQATISATTPTESSPSPTPTKSAEAAKPKVTRTHARPSHSDVVLAGGIVLPNRALTPGATNPNVTQSSIRRTICLTGYTSTIRPSSSYTTSLKVQQLSHGYAWHGDQDTSDYEEDHLISLELGGSPSSPKNLWPEPYPAREGAKVKDLVENKLHDLVCSGALSLRRAQKAIATNWWRAYQAYGGIAVPRAFEGTYGQPKPAATRTQASGGGGLDARFGTCAEAIDHGYGPYYRGQDPEYDWYRDADNDGVVCER